MLYFYIMEKIFVPHFKLEYNAQFNIPSRSHLSCEVAVTG